MSVTLESTADGVDIDVTSQQLDSAAQTYRRRMLTRLRRQEIAARSVDLSSLAGILAAIDSHRDRQDAMDRIARQRATMTGKPCKLTIDPLTAGVLVPIDPTTARKAGASIDMRGKDATCRPCRARSHGEHSAGETRWKNGRPVSYTRATHHNWVRSIALVIDTQTVEYACHTARVTVTLPCAYRWDVDAHGLRVVRDDSQMDDYHVCAADLIGRDAARRCVESLERNRVRRLLTAAQNAATRAELAGVWVCLADSLRAGNCEAGTRSFAARHGLDVAAHYRATALLALVQRESVQDACRLRLAITAATLRHRRECEAGICRVSDHRLPRAA